MDRGRKRWIAQGGGTDAGKIDGALKMGMEMVRSALGKDLEQEVAEYLDKCEPVLDLSKSHL